MNKSRENNRLIGVASASYWWQRLVAILVRGRLHWFGVYCLLVAGIGLWVV